MGKWPIHSIAGGLALWLALAPAPRAESASRRPGIDLPPPGAAEWRPVVFPSIARHTRYTVVPRSEHGGPGPAFLAESDCSASGMALPLDGIDVERTPVLEWSWKVVRGLDIANEREKAGDDFAARVYVLFRFDRSAASLGARLIHSISTRLAGREVPGHVLDYVWASRAAPGESWQNPYDARTQMRALRSGSLRAGAGSSAESGWRRERVDLLADHRRRAGGSGRTEVMAIAIMSDSDDTCRRSAALFAGFRLTSAGPRPAGGAALQPSADAEIGIGNERRAPEP